MDILLLEWFVTFLWHMLLIYVYGLYTTQLNIT